MYSNASTVPSYAELQPYLADLSTLPPLSEQEAADLLSIHRLEFWKLAGQGRLKEWDRAQPLSLDASSEEEASPYEVLPASTARTPVASAALRQQVELRLSRLTPRERSVLRLLYGLDEADGRALSRREIAAHLGVALGVVTRARLHRTRPSGNRHHGRATGEDGQGRGTGRQRLSA